MAGARDSPALAFFWPPSCHGYLVGRSVTGLWLRMQRIGCWHGILSLPTIYDWAFAHFLIPVEAWRREMIKQPGIIEGMIIIVLGAVLVWVVAKARKYFSEPQQESMEDRIDAGSREIIPFTTSLFLFSYLASIVAAMTMFDAATKFKLRILSPAFVCLLILL